MLSVLLQLPPLLLLLLQYFKSFTSSPAPPAGSESTFPSGGSRYCHSPLPAVLSLMFPCGEWCHMVLWQKLKQVQLFYLSTLHQDLCRPLHWSQWNERRAHNSRTAVCLTLCVLRCNYSFRVCCALSEKQLLCAPPPLWRIQYVASALQGCPQCAEQSRYALKF